MISRAAPEHDFGTVPAGRYAACGQLFRALLRSAFDRAGGVAHHAAMEDRPRTPRVVDGALAVSGSSGGRLMKTITDAMMSLSSRITRENLDEQLSKTLPL